MTPRLSAAAIRELCRLGLPAPTLVPAVLEALHGLVPSYRNLFDWTDAEGRLLHYFIEGPIDSAVARLYFEEFHNRRETEVMPPYAELRRTPAGVLGADALDHPAFFASDFYNEIWRPQGLRTRLQAVLRGQGGRLLGTLVLYRAPREPRFTAADERLLAGVLPAFAAGLQFEPGPEHGAHAAQPEPAEHLQSQSAEAQHVPSPDPPETLLLTLQGEVCHASPGAQRLLLMAQGGVSREALARPIDALSGPLLPPLLARLREQAARRGPPAQDQAQPCVTSRQTVSGRYLAHGRLLHPQGGAGSLLAQATLHRLEPRTVALARAWRDLPVTPGQMAVGRLLCEGRSQAEAAERLGVAPATVVDHVRKLYRALDVRSALALRAFIDGRVRAA